LNKLVVHEESSCCFFFPSPAGKLQLY
jgi:hypothetical protein